MQFQRVLCPVDLSEMSAAPVRLARGMVAGAGQGELVLLHVTAPAVAVADGLAMATTDLETELARRDLEAKFPAGPGARTRFEVRRGGPAEAICRFAADERCDLVVMSTHGRTGLTRLIMGSVAEEVLRHAPCPVLLVRPGITVPSPHPAQATARSSPTTRVRP